MKKFNFGAGAMRRSDAAQPLLETAITQKRLATFIASAAVGMSAGAHMSAAPPARRRCEAQLHEGLALTPMLGAVGIQIALEDSLEENSQ
jgi:hypothetical protein